MNERGWTLGHFPDSFNHSTLGGWIATRSSGMQSDKYGDIAELTRALRVVTRRRLARVYRQDGTESAMSESESLDGEAVVPGFSCPLAAIL